ncbi:MAG: translation initiation factor IF-3 [Deltaproteobacteria bacterium]|nr:translation initiation factor IF-3 [Deltaproteobacteria bacterium]RKX61034.1 MAG: translation initiation factor IF-3 [Thermodesulfobacteriota bacterium]MBW1946595.1 translation initiation factor IF-3 [Deltaproteobacteria bacterium]MBW1966664.1 translation initiation factor IF-3 [Deltaproteobacteria bacterium]MBW2098510.1 translation initiation factor IF-3 [Deltaproteobacteria bacterium]
MAREIPVKVNYRISAKEVRLIGKDGKQLGVVTRNEALAKAEELGLDLVEVAPHAQPPVCRIMDYGKFKYEQSKKAQEARKKQTIIQVKEIKMRPRTDVHDLEVKKKRIRQFIGDGNKVKVTVRFRGRENAYPELGFALIKRIVEEMSDIAVPENVPVKQGPLMHTILAPKD